MKKLNFKPGKKKVSGKHTAKRVAAARRRINEVTQEVSQQREAEFAKRQAAEQQHFEDLMGGTAKQAAEDLSAKTGTQYQDPYARPSKMKALDALLNLDAICPGGKLSPSMENLLYGGEKPRILIVKAVHGTITDREGFETKMAQLGFRVVFLEFDKSNFSVMPVIERVAP